MFNAVETSYSVEIKQRILLFSHRYCFIFFLINYLLFEIVDNEIYVYCGFDFLHTNESLSITMIYLNSDWKQASDKDFKITTPGVETALNANFTCTQKVGIFPL
jgi:hypothetical protein